MSCWVRVARPGRGVLGVRFGFDNDSELNVQVPTPPSGHADPAGRTTITRLTSPLWRECLDELNQDRISGNELSVTVLFIW